MTHLLKHINAVVTSRSGYGYTARMAAEGAGATLIAIDAEGNIVEEARAQLSAAEVIRYRSPGGGKSAYRAGMAGGIHFIATADIDACGQSERITGAAHTAPGVARSDSLRATKTGGGMRPGPNDNPLSQPNSASQMRFTLAPHHIDTKDKTK